MLLRLFVTRILGLPFWWYGRGFKITSHKFFGLIIDMSKTLALNVWVKNIFIPMYGDTSFAGHLISFLIRLVIILFRGIGFVIFSLAVFIFLVAYLFILPITIVGLFYYIYKFFV